MRLHLYHCIQSTAAGVRASVLFLSLYVCICRVYLYVYVCIYIEYICMYMCMYMWSTSMYVCVFYERRQIFL